MTAARVLARGRLGKLARAMRTACCLNRDLHRTRRTLFLVGGVFRWSSQLIDQPDQKEDSGRDDEKIDHQRNEVAVIPGNRSGLCGVCGSIEWGRAILGCSENEKFI